MLWLGLERRIRGHLRCPQQDRAPKGQRCRSGILRIEGESATSEFFGRHAWKMLLVLAAILFLFGIGDIIRGLDADPAIIRSITGQTLEELRKGSPVVVKVGQAMTRGGGIQIAAIGILITAILLTGFRRRERWAWYAMWTLPGWSVAVFILMLSTERAHGTPPPPPLISAPIFAVVSAGLLLAAAPAFFSAVRADPGD
jgi:hypothetical protein